MSIVNGYDPDPPEEETEITDDDIPNNLDPDDEITWVEEHTDDDDFILL